VIVVSDNDTSLIVEEQKSIVRMAAEIEHAENRAGNLIE
jgi:hypothetical protein